MSAFKRVLAGLLRRAGLRVERSPFRNRFDCVEDCLVGIRALGYAPKVVIDVGANRGQFYRRTGAIFPRAEYHLIEPQPACAGELSEISNSSAGRVTFHPVAISRPDTDSVRLLGGGIEGGSTGAYVGMPDERSPDEVEVRATTLDRLLCGRLGREDRAFLKIDVEMHEVAVLEGAPRVLERTEVMLIEVSFFNVEDSGNPIFLDVLTLVERHGFILFDIAALAARRRDNRLRMGDIVLVKKGTPLLTDSDWN